MFEGILLEKEQKDLLSKLVEASWNLPSEKREQFTYMHAMGADIILHHGLPNKRIVNTNYSDLVILRNNGLIFDIEASDTTWLFDMSPLGFEYYRFLKSKEGKPLKSVQKDIRKYIDEEVFRKHRDAYDKWRRAEGLLWESDSEKKLTTIGHLCREAMQEFATALIIVHNPSDFDEDKAHSISRLKSVINIYKDKLGETERAFLDVLLKYWKSISDLAQRQEHGGEREKENLIWEDGRRLVFQTCILMYECDRALSRVS